MLGKASLEEGSYTHAPSKKMTAYYWFTSGFFFNQFVLWLFPIFHDGSRWLPLKSAADSSGIYTFVCQRCVYRPSYLRKFFFSLPRATGHDWLRVTICLEDDCKLLLLPIARSFPPPFKLSIEYFLSHPRLLSFFKKRSWNDIQCHLEHSKRESRGFRGQEKEKKKMDGRRNRKVVRLDAPSCCKKHHKSWSLPPHRQ